jgi:hypothetical protein
MGQRDTAESYLQQAYSDVMRQADLIKNEELRHNFLNNVPANRQIVAAAQGC